MSATEKSNRLQSHLLYMIALENDIAQSLGGLLSKVSNNTEVSELLSDYQTTAVDHKNALETRLQIIGSKISISNESLTIPYIAKLGDENHAVSTALQTAYTLFNQAIIGYAILHPLATRFADSLVIADDGTSYHLCRKHTQNYIEAIQKISLNLHDTVLWELDQEHIDCQCTCPSCGVGVCVCALAGRAFLRDAWMEAGPIPADVGVFIQTPRENSAALKVGLHLGDMILAAEGQEIDTYSDLQNIVRETEPGGDIRLTVRHHNAVEEDVIMVRP